MKESISYAEQFATLFDFTDGRVTKLSTCIHLKKPQISWFLYKSYLCERQQNRNKASKGTGFEFVKERRTKQWRKRMQIELTSVNSVINVFNLRSFFKISI